MDRHPLAREVVRPPRTRPQPSPHNGPTRSTSARATMSLTSPKEQVILSRTCQNCYHLKIRCERTNPEGSCDRCRRLEKECIFRPSRRRYNSSPRRPGRIESLEAKIEELMRERASITNDPRTPSDASHTSRSYNFNDALTPDGPADYADGEGDVIDAGLLGEEEAENIVSLYKTSMTPHFPFVVLEPHATASILRREKPFLFLCILAAASLGNMPFQRKLGEKVKKKVNHYLMFGGEVKFEMLQGLLVFLAWCHYHSKPKRYSQYLQLAISIVVDLRLDNDPVGGWKAHVGSPTGMELHRGIPPQRALDEKRALAGCFYLSSSISKLLQKWNTFPYSDYLDRCCVSLISEGSAASDRQIYHLVQLQRIIESTKYATLPQCSQEEATATVCGARLQLETFREHLQFGLEDDSEISHLSHDSRCWSAVLTPAGTLYMQYRTAELFLCQAAFFEKAVPLDASLHSELVILGLNAVRAMFEYYLSLPEESERFFNNTEWVQFSFALTVATRMVVSATYDHTQSLDLAQVIHSMFNRISMLVTEQRDERGYRDVFFNYQERLMRIETWFERYNTLKREAGMPENGSNHGPSYSGHGSRTGSAAPHQHIPVIPEINVVPAIDPAMVDPAIDPALAQIGPAPAAHWNTYAQSPASAHQTLPLPVFPEFSHFFQGWDWSYPPNP
ncbi:hypothetical protein F4780DRAFT_31042 [Xylariomycetidae sp. FL0641]|nr:hypothetical protein F4780DRAFT_31042 [Xylariomycetidae sp. FL0641]